MNQPANVAAQYLAKQIENASPAEQVVMLYDGAVRFLLRAKKAIEDNNVQERYNNNRRAGDIILYLMSILDHEAGGEVARNLERNYLYMSRRLMAVDLQNDVSAIDDVVARLKTLRISWEKIAKGAGGQSAGDAKKSQSNDEESVASRSTSAIA